jgi:hypothetical protein
LLRILEVSQLDLSLLHLSESINITLVAFLSFLLSCQDYSHLLLNVALEGRDSLVYGDSVWLGLVVVAHLGDECSCIDHLEVRSDASQVVLLSIFQGKRIFSNHCMLPKEVDEQSLKSWI